MFRLQHLSHCLLVIATLACNSSEENKTKVASAEQPSGASEKASASDNQTGLVGTWKLQLEVADDNQNQKMEDAEKEKGFKNNYILQLKADGTCRIQQIYDGRYEEKTEKGKKMLYVYRKKVEPEETKDPVPDIYEIKSMQGNEMVVMPFVAGFSSTFWIFKKA